MLKGTTESGFVYEISEDRLNNYELLEYISEIEDNPMVLPKVVKGLLGAEQTIALKNHLRNDDGIVPAEKFGQTIEEIFQNHNQTKNS